MKKKIRKFSLFFVFISFIFSTISIAQAPAIQWNKLMSGSYNCSPWCIIPTSDCGYIVAGYNNGGKTSGADGDVTEPYHGGSEDAWIVKLDANGNKIWDRLLGSDSSDYLVSISQTSDGGYIAAGSRTLYYIGDPVNGVYYHGISEYWVVKLDANGKKIWEKVLGGNDLENGGSIKQTSDGGYIVVGSSSSSVSGAVTGTNHGGFDYWVVKLDANGNKVWDKLFGGTGDEGATALSLTSDGGCIVAGYSNSSANGDVSGTLHRLNDYWIIKLDANGNKIWDKLIGGSGNDKAAAIIITNDGGCIVAGTSNSSVSGDVTGVNHGYDDFWIVKLDAYGNKVWNKLLGGSFYETAYSITASSDGGYTVAGSTTSSASGDVTGINHAYSGNTLGYLDYWIIKLDANGNRVWDKLLGGNNDDYATSISSTGDDGYVIAGVSDKATSGDMKGIYLAYGTYWLIKLGVNSLVIPSVSIAATPAGTVCQGSTVVFTATPSNTSGGKVSYNFTVNGITVQNGSSNIFSSKALANGDTINCTITVIVGTCSVVASAISNTITQVISATPLPTISIIASPAGALCSGSSIVFTASSSNGGVLPIFQWQKNGLNIGTDNNTFSDSLFANGDSITCTLIVNTGCSNLNNVTSRPIILSIYPLPTINLDKTQTLCIGTSRTLDAGNQVSYLWNDGSTGRTLNVQNLGTYYVAVTDIHGCKNNDTVEILSKLPSPHNFLPMDTSICNFSSLTINANSSYINYLWSNNSVQSFISIDQPGLYWLAVTDKNKCVGRDSISVVTKQCGKGIFIPSAFSPNGDNINDLFKPTVYGTLVEYKMSVYNRWGQKVFETYDVTIGWKGQVNGKEQLGGTFVWTCDYKFIGDVEEIKKGTVILIR